MFGSYSYLWDMNPSNEEDKQTIVSNIINRHRTILKMLKTPTLLYHQSTNLCSILLGPIPDINSKPVINNYNIIQAKLVLSSQVALQRTNFASHFL